MKLIKLRRVMESHSILENFLLAKADLESIIPFPQFKKECPPDIPEERAREIYDVLVRQRRATVESVRDRIDQEFNVPLEVTKQKARESNVIPDDKGSLNELVGKLESLEESFKTNNELIDSEIKEEIAEIKLIIDELNDLKYGKSWIRGGSQADVSLLVQETLKSIAKCEKMLP